MGAMWVGLTVDESIKDEDAYTIVIGESDLRSIVQNLDGIGHAPATMELLDILKKWGITKS